MVELKIAVEDKVVKRARELASAQACTVDQLISNLVLHQPVMENGAHRESQEISDAERIARIGELDRILALNIEAPDDGLSNRDHDKILYGGKW